MNPRRAGRCLTGVLALLLALDLLGLVVSGGDSLPAGGHGTVTGVGFALRLSALGLLLTWRLRVLAERPLPWTWLTLLLLLLPALAEFHFAGGRLGGDGVSYYVYTRSLAMDRDLDFTNEYTAFGLLTRGDLALPTRTGLRRSIFALGPGLLGLPFFALGEVVARAQSLVGRDVVRTGYGPCHVNATALGGLLYGFGALACVHALLRRHFRPTLALAAVLLLWGATFLHWYMVQQPLTSHAASACAAAGVVWLWDRGRSRRGVGGHALLGLLIGAAMCVRWQNGVLLVLPALDLLVRAWRARQPRPSPEPQLQGHAVKGVWGGRRPPGPLKPAKEAGKTHKADPTSPGGSLRRHVPQAPDDSQAPAAGASPHHQPLPRPHARATLIAPGGTAPSPPDPPRSAAGVNPAAERSLVTLGLSAAALLLAAALGALPQLAAWKVIYGEWLLAAPPHGADFLRLWRPFALETLFSSRHGLLSWTPVLWAGYLGFVPLWRRRPQLAAPLALPLLLMTYVNMCSGDWWAGGSFSNRRFDSLLPIFAPALAAALDAALGFARRHATLALWAVGVPLGAWNLALAAQTERGLIPRDDTVAFAQLAENGWRVAAERAGSPPTWPASWLFAQRHARPAGHYDLLVGRYLFYRQNNLGGGIDLGAPGDEALLGEGFTRAEARGGVTWRRVRASARLFAPLDLPEPLEVRVRAQAVGAPCEVRLTVNGRLAGRFVAAAAWAEARVSAPAALWRRDLNDVRLEVDGGELRVDRVSFVRRALE